MTVTIPDACFTGAFARRSTPYAARRPARAPGAFRSFSNSSLFTSVFLLVRVAWFFSRVARETRGGSYPAPCPRRFD